MAATPMMVARERKLRVRPACRRMCAIRTVCLQRPCVLVEAEAFPTSPCVLAHGPSLPNKPQHGGWGTTVAMAVCSVQSFHKTSYRLGGCCLFYRFCRRLLRRRCLGCGRSHLDSLPCGLQLGLGKPGSNLLGHPPGAVLPHDPRGHLRGESRPHLVVIEERLWHREHAEFVVVGIDDVVLR